MLDRIKHNLQCRNAFSAAEMLLVMLIIAFLILAMPPLVHKKFEKRVTRGEHGRYECWKMPNGDVYEFLATEKGGPIDRSTMVGADGRPKGRLLGRNATCRFNPQEWAPSAAFFSMQVVGGGAGGSYAPYNPNDENYYKVNATNEKPVLLKTNSFSISSGTDTAAWEELKHYNYWAYLSYYDRYNETKWVKRYFPPVISKSSVQFCSGRGHNGNINVAGDLTKDEENKGLSIFAGGRGGNGVCYTVAAGDLAIGVNSSEDYYYAQPQAVQDQFQPDPGTSYLLYSNNGGSGAWKYIYKMDLYSPANYWMSQAEVERIVGSIRTSTYEWYCANSQSATRELVHDGFVWLPDLSLNGHSWYKSCSNPSCKGCYNLNFDIHAQRYLPTDSAASLGTVSYAQTIMEGAYGEDYHADISNPVPTAQSALEIYGDMSASDPILKFPSSNSDGAKASKKATEIFPTTITMKYKYNYNTPTYGYAGKSGASASLMLPKLSGKLEITLGDGGAAGVYHATDMSKRKGENGHDTVVWQKELSASDATTCNNNTCKYILTGKGGLSLHGGVSGPKITLLGSNTCESYGASAQGHLHLCLDRGVALPSEAEMRFSDDSGFASIPEFDKRTKTPSALNTVFRNESLKPGSGGDGGYSFVTDNSGTESVKAENHTNFSPNSLSVIGQPGWFNGGGGWLNRNNSKAAGLAGEVASYQCYGRDGLPSDGSSKSVSGWAKARACEPKAGRPGAVVIVW